MAKRKNKKRQSKPKTIDVNLKLKLQLEQSKPTRARRRVIKPRQRPNLRAVRNGMGGLTAGNMQQPSFFGNTALLGNSAMAAMNNQRYALESQLRDSQAELSASQRSGRAHAAHIQALQQQTQALTDNLQRTQQQHSRRPRTGSADEFYYQIGDDMVREQEEQQRRLRQSRGKQRTPSFDQTPVLEERDFDAGATSSSGGSDEEVEEVQSRASQGSPTLTGMSGGGVEPEPEPELQSPALHSRMDEARGQRGTKINRHITAFQAADRRLYDLQHVGKLKRKHKQYEPSLEAAEAEVARTRAQLKTLADELAQGDVAHQFAQEFSEIGHHVGAGTQ